MSTHKDIFDRNIDRVKSLCALYNSLKTKEVKEGKDYKFTDVLRSAVVCLHSSFEEYFRSVLRDTMPSVCTQEDLAKIPFVSKDGRHYDKISVGSLLQYKGKSVDSIISGFIGETLDTTSFNNYSDIVNWSQRIKVDLSGFSAQEKIERMIKRRHRIVHEADNNKAGKENNTYSLTPIQESTVVEWIAAVQELVTIIDTQIGGNNNGNIQM